MTDSRLNPNLFSTRTTNPTTAQLQVVDIWNSGQRVLDERAERLADAGFDVEQDSSGQYTVTEIPE